MNMTAPIQMKITAGIIGNVAWIAMTTAIDPTRHVAAIINASSIICNESSAKSIMEVHDIPPCDDPENALQLEANELRLYVFALLSVDIGPTLIEDAHSGAATGGT